MNNKTVNEIFAHNLKNRLMEKRMSQQDLARKLDVSTTTVSKWVNAEIVPRPKNIDQICQILVCTAESLMTDHSKVVELAPEDVLAEELRDNPRLFRLMFYASKLSDRELDDLIVRAKK